MTDLRILMLSLLITCGFLTTLILLQTKEQLRFLSASLQTAQGGSSCSEQSVTPSIFAYLNFDAESRTADVRSTSIRNEGKALPLDVDQKRSNIGFIDILSVGSVARPYYLDVQENTFGAHRYVRNFYRVNELNDTERNCNAELSDETLLQLVDHCMAQNKFSTLSKLKHHFLKHGNTKWIMGKTNPAGWVCAQKRPLDGLYSLLSQYREQIQHIGSSEQVLPDYLFVMDDDTWVNMDAVMGYCREHYPSNQAYVVAGCLHRENIDIHNYTFPCGGFSSIFTRPAIQNLLRPIDCQGRATLSIKDDEAPPAFDGTMEDDNFEKLACWRLRRNQAGEQQFFRDGMSVADLMHAYSSQQPFADPSRWGSPGFCMHSDVALSYFINFYHIPVHSNETAFLDVPEDRYRGFNGSVIYHGRRSTPELKELIRANSYECKHSDDDHCSSQASFCHHVSAEHMEVVHQALLHQSKSR